jgi:hypothetical protein
VHPSQWRTGKCGWKCGSLDSSDRQRESAKRQPLKKQMRWCGIARAPRRSPDAELTDDGLLMEVRWRSSHRFGRAADGDARADIASIKRCGSPRFGRNEKSADWFTIPRHRDGESPSGKAAAFGAAIRRFESSLPRWARPRALLGLASADIPRSAPISDTTPSAAIVQLAPPIRRSRPPSRRFQISKTSKLNSFFVIWRLGRRAFLTTPPSISMIRASTANKARRSSRIRSFRWRSSHVRFNRASDS